MIVIETVLAVWLGLGAVFAGYGFATEDHSDLPPLQKIGLFVSVVLGWPIAFLPSRQTEYRPYHRISFPDNPRRKPKLRVVVGGTPKR